jgi:hypothetical protein
MLPEVVIMLFRAPILRDAEETITDRQQGQQVSYSIIKQSLTEPFSSLEAQVHHNLSGFYLTHCAYIVPGPLP